MRTAATFGGAILAIAALTSPAYACRVMISPEKRIENAYARNSDLQVASVEVVDARYLSTPTVRIMKERFPDYEAPWRAVASISRLVAGGESPQLVMFDRNFGSGSCDDGTSMPAKGDRWIIYYLADSLIAPANVLESYPVSVASKADPRLRDLVR